MGIKQMQGTSAYLEYIGPQGRKRRKNCIYNEDNKCRNTRIQNYLSNCVGRMYCAYFEEDDKLNSSDSIEYKLKKSSGERNIKISRININQEVIEENLLNKKFKILDIDDNETIEITLVEEKNKDILCDRISIKSPMGQALCKAEIGSEFEIYIRNNRMKYRLIGISE